MDTMVNDTGGGEGGGGLWGLLFQDMCRADPVNMTQIVKWGQKEQQ